MDIGFPISLISLIMKCVTMVTIHVHWTRVFSDSFPLSRGIRQCDPLSLYLFVCIERLEHLIDLEVSRGRSKLIMLSRMGPHLSHLFFVDDLILFFKANIE